MLKPRCWQGWFFLGPGSEERIHFLAFAVSRDCIPRFMALSFLVSLKFFDSIVMPPTTHSSLLPPSYKDPCDYISLTWMSQDTFPSSEFLISHICKVPFSCKVTDSPESGVRMWLSLGGHYSVCHRWEVVLLLKGREGERILGGMVPCAWHTVDTQ